MSIFGFYTRLVAFALVSLIAIQMIAFTWYFVQRGKATDTGFRLPLPDQVAALVSLIEPSDGDTRKQILRAVNGARLVVTIEPGWQAGPVTEWQRTPWIEDIVQRYLAELGGRSVAVLVQAGDQPVFLRGRGPAMLTPSAAEIRVGMRTGETLVVATSGVLTIGIFGFPPGFWAGVLGFSITLLGAILVWRQARPLRELKEAVDAMAVSGEGRPIVVASARAPHITALVEAFNRLQERIADLLSERMALVGGISHDLRTYVTRLRLRAELISDDDERARAITDLDEMTKLLEDALLAIRTGHIAGANAGQFAGAESLVDLGELVRAEVRDRLAGGMPVRLIEPNAALALPVLGDAVALKRVLANILDNAIAYGQRAEVRQWVADGRAVVAIDDEGPGIPVALRDRVRDPFVRLEGSRSRATGGAGLGLAIAHNLTEAHGGDLMISDAPTGGARVSVRLPLFVPDGLAQGR